MGKVYPDEALPTAGVSVSHRGRNDPEKEATQQQSPPDIPSLVVSVGSYNRYDRLINGSEERPNAPEVRQ